MSNNKIELIKNTLDIVDVIQEYVDLSKKGKNYWGVCPFHDDSNPSMSVSPEKQMYKCFSCDKAGGIFKFVQDIEKISFYEAAEKLGNKAGVEINLIKSEPKYNERQKKLIDALNDAMDYYQASIDSEDAINALDYANKRGLNSKIREKFKIGYAPKKGLINYLTKIRHHNESDLINASLMNSIGEDFMKDRLIFGIANEFGDTIAMSGRTLKNDQAKYINSSESLIFKKSHILYNWNNANKVAKKNNELILVEGFMDVIALYKANIENVVAIMGTALTKENINKIRGLKIILMFDSDKAGISATIKSIRILLENGIKTYVAQNPSGIDPDELFNSKGEKAIKEIIDNRITALEFIYISHKNKYDISKIEEIEKFVESFKKYLIYASPVERDFLINKIKNELGVSREILVKDLKINKTIVKAQTTHNENKVLNQKKNEYNQEKYDIKYNKSAYILIRSLLKSKSLSEYYDRKRHEINYVDRTLPIIGTYIIAAHRGIEKIPNKYKKYIKEKINLEGETIEKNEDLDDIIKVINKNHKSYEKNKNRIKFNKKKDGNYGKSN
ncbi:MAG: DNA primase [Mycoplasmatales bacterium]|nr:DNA primase [Mycoplasmatales bacterium]